MGEPAALYARVSLGKQAGIPTQAEQMRLACPAYEIEPVSPPLEQTTFWEDNPIDENSMATMVAEGDVWCDEGVSGGDDPTTRPGFKAMMAHVRQEGIKVIVFYHNDRFSRDTETSLRIIREWREEGIRPMFCNIPTLKFDTPEDDLLFTNLAMLARYYKEDLRRKTAAGMQRKKNEGVWIGEPPYGLYCIKKRDEGDEYGILMYCWPEIDILSKAVRHYTNTIPPSFNGTAKFLNSQGYTTRHGKKWTYHHIRNMLTKCVLSFDLDDKGRKVARFFKEGMDEIDKE